MFPLWLCQNSYWTWPFIVDFPMKSMVIFNSYVKLPDGRPSKRFKWSFNFCFRKTLFEASRKVEGLEACGIFWSAFLISHDSHPFDLHPLNRQIFGFGTWMRKDGLGMNNVAFIIVSSHLVRKTQSWTITDNLILVEYFGRYWIYHIYIYVIMCIYIYILECTVSSKPTKKYAIGRAYLLWFKWFGM